jgi:hypothetical protein
MEKFWYEQSFGFDDIQADGGQDFDWTIGAGATLIRSVVSIYIAGHGFVDLDPIAPLVAAPAAWMLVETNSSINPVPPDMTPFGITGRGHKLAGKMVTMSGFGVVRRFSTTGTSDTDVLGHATYDLTDTDVSEYLIMGNSYEDSHAQRFFPDANPAFSIVIQPGPLASRLSGGNYAAAAIVKQLFQVPS